MTVQSFFRFLAREDFLPSDPSSTLQLPKRKKTLPKGIMSARDVLRILEAPKGTDPLTIRDRAILEVLYGTGMRNSELRCLTIFDVEVRSEQLRVKDGKGKKERLVPLGEYASYYVGRYLAEGRPHLVKDSSQTLLFVSKNGRQITSANLIWIVKKYVRKAKLAHEATPHCFRHSCASHMLKGQGRSAAHPGAAGARLGADHPGLYESRAVTVERGSRAMSSPEKDGIYPLIFSFLHHLQVRNDASGTVAL